MEAYKETARSARLKVLDLIYAAQSSHIGSNFSCIDVLTVLFSKIDTTKDEFVLSAGWKAAALYYFLWTKGVITQEELDSYCQEGSPFIGLVEPMGRFGLRVAGGSMGLGFPMAVGMALAKQINWEEGRVYVLMSDGEMNAGTTWEALAIAAHHHLTNLVLIVDANGLQAMGKTSEVLSMHNLETKFRSFGWMTASIDGHDHASIAGHLAVQPHAPLALIAHTTKGKGVDFMEGENIWHYKAPNADEYLKAQQCLKS